MITMNNRIRVFLSLFLISSVTEVSREKITVNTKNIRYRDNRALVQ